MSVAVLGPPGVTCSQNLLLPRALFQLTCTVTPIPSHVGGTALTALPRNAVHIREALLLTGVLGVFTEVAEGVVITLAAGHLKWVADHWAARIKVPGCFTTDPSGLRTHGPCVLVLVLPTSTEHFLDQALGLHISARRHTVLQPICLPGPLFPPTPVPGPCPRFSASLLSHHISLPKILFRVRQGLNK